MGAKALWLPAHVGMAVAMLAPDFPLALKYIEDQIEISERDGDLGRLSMAHAIRAAWLYNLIDEPREEVAEQALSLARQAENPTMIGWALLVNGIVHAESDPDAAMKMLNESFSYCRSVDYRWCLATGLTLECTIRAQHGDPLDAFSPIDEAIELWRKAGDWSNQWKTVKCIITPLTRIGALDTAAVIYGASDGRTIFGELPEGLVQQLDNSLGQLKSQMGAEEFAAAVSRGKQLDDDEAIGFIREEIARILVEQSK
jgi:hypothetical protein